MLTRLSVIRPLFTSYATASSYLSRKSFVIQQQNYRYRLTDDEIASYKENGYISIKKLFSQQEIEILLNTLTNDDTVSNMSMEMKDASGGISKCTLWMNQNENDNTYTMFARNKSLVRAAKDLISTEPYIIHSKFMLKEPYVGGKWEWHQDFGYWYMCGCMNPNQMMSVIIAIDKADKTNGCLQILKRSHLVGRIEHKASGEQAGADIRYVNMILDKFEKEYCEMEPGDVLFTHSNLFHASDANKSDKWRRYLIIAYNGKDNQPWKEWNSVMPSYEKINIVDDNSILEFGSKGFDNKQENKYNFLDHDTNLIFAKED